MNTITPIRATTRIAVIDVVRGFALLLIFTVHMFERFLANMPTKGIYGRNPGLLNKILSFVQPLLTGKGFAIFTMLFGLSFLIMMASADRKGIDFRGRFAWRVTILFVIGYVHSLFFRGDVLTIYAILGLALILFYHASNKTLAVVAFLILSGVPRYLLFYFLHGQPLLPSGAGDPTTPLNLAYVDAVTRGGLWDVFRSNAVDGHKWFFTIQFDMIGRGYLTFCYFLAGLWLGRIALFEKLDAFAPKIKRTFWISLAVALPAMFGSLFAAMTVFAKGVHFESWAAVFTLVAFDIANTTAAIAILCGFLLLYRTVRGKRLFASLGPFGRMALTNYVMQSLIATFIFYNWGLGLMAKVRHTHVALLAILIIAFQMAFSALWLRYFLYGPLEWLWRSATYLRWQPLRKREGNWVIVPEREPVLAARPEAAVKAPVKDRPAR